MQVATQMDRQRAVRHILMLLKRPELKVVKYNLAWIFFLLLWYKGHSLAVTGDAGRHHPARQGFCNGVGTR